MVLEGWRHTPLRSVLRPPSLRTAASRRSASVTLRCFAPNPAAHSSRALAIRLIAASGFSSAKSTLPWRYSAAATAADRGPLSSALIGVTILRAATASRNCPCRICSLTIWSTASSHSPRNGTSVSLSPHTRVRASSEGGVLSAAVSRSTARCKWLSAAPSSPAFISARAIATRGAASSGAWAPCAASAAAIVLASASTAASCDPRAASTSANDRRSSVAMPSASGTGGGAASSAVSAACSAAAAAGCSPSCLWSAAAATCIRNRTSAVVSPGGCPETAARALSRFRRALSSSLSAAVSRAAGPARGGAVALRAVESGTAAAPVAFAFVFWDALRLAAAESGRAATAT
mmetsp:Transcript_25575/g.77126  ORF Transcript_25575/g.77126 Transcript_25575/m.77126 type:complete len:348 (+) Transcript_25575:144-1187(+)